MTSLVLGDDHLIFLEALVPVLERRGMRVLGVASTLAGTIEKVRETDPDICLLDRNFGEAAGGDGPAAVLAANQRTKVVMLTADPDNAAIVEAVRSGATGYVHKTRGVDHLVDIIKRVASGEVVIDVPATEPPARAPVIGDIRWLATHLTGRERQCLGLLVDGHGTSAIARRLGVSSATVRSHVQSLLMKLGVHSRLEAVSLASRHGLIDDLSPARR